MVLLPLFQHSHTTKKIVKITKIQSQPGKPTHNPVTTSCGVTTLPVIHWPTNKRNDIMNYPKQKIGFCITCMNRLHHLQATLIRNIEDNNLPGEVEFVLLDYNSSDGLSEWVKTLTPYLASGILSYYKTNEPTYYERSHSRNMAFRLSGADILCNLDADNYLGKGFASYILNIFKINAGKNIFITSTCLNRDLFGRVCILKDDFYKLRGYDESLTGYGVEDIDLFHRCMNAGYAQVVFSRKDFCNVILHSHKERISQEEKFLSLESVYIKHKTPYCIDFIIFYKGSQCELGRLTNNFLCNFNTGLQFSNIIEMFYDETSRFIVSSLQAGQWKYSDTTQNKITLITNNNNTDAECKFEGLELNKSTYYKIKDEEVLAEFIVNLSDGLNFNTVKVKLENHTLTTNPAGYGMGVVFKNFELKEIILN